MTLIADGFLAGSLLTLLLPVALLLALVYWYLHFIRKVPETVEGKETAAASNPGPGGTPLAANPVSDVVPGAADPPDSTHTVG